MKDLITNFAVTTEEARMIERFKMYRDLVNPEVAEKMAVENLSIYGYAKWTVDTLLSPEQTERLNEIKKERFKKTAI
jgi:predicted DNA-binding protein YlxM (UPF0122 family)